MNSFKSSNSINLGNRDSGRASPYKQSLSGSKSPTKRGTRLVPAYKEFSDKMRIILKRIKFKLKLVFVIMKAAKELENVLEYINPFSLSF